MNAPRSPVTEYLELHRSLAARLNGAGERWLDERRDGALQRFAALGFPAPGEEAWKYTRVAPIERRTFRPAADACLGLDAEDIAAHLALGAAAHRMVFVNGRYARALSAPPPPAAGVTVGSLAAAFTDYRDLLRDHLARHADPAARGFTALNTAFLDDGAFIHLQAKASLAEPLHLLFLSTASDGLASYPRVLLLAGEDARADLIESHAALGDAAYLSDAVSELVLGRGARVRHCHVQDEASKAYHVGALQVAQARESSYELLSVALGGRLARVDVQCSLDEPEANCSLQGLYLAGARQHVDYHTRIDHRVAHGTSREQFKGVVGAHGRAVFNAMVQVHPDAQRSDAMVRNANLLLARSAEVDTKPELEIYADDVKCAHGATVGQLDEQMVFYLRSRGIDAEAARRMLTLGFAREVTGEVNPPVLREYLEARVAERLEQISTTPAERSA